VERPQTNTQSCLAPQLDDAALRHSTNGEDAALKPLAVAAVKGYKHCVRASLWPNSRKSVPLVHFMYKVTTERTFENVHRQPVRSGNAHRTRLLARRL
jgi:hypothetical protein